MNSRETELKIPDLNFPFSQSCYESTQALKKKSRRFKKVLEWVYSASCISVCMASVYIISTIFNLEHRCPDFLHGIIYPFMFFLSLVWIGTSFESDVSKIHNNKLINWMTRIIYPTYGREYRKLEQIDQRLKNVLDCNSLEFSMKLLALIEDTCEVKIKAIDSDILRDCQILQGKLEHLIPVLKKSLGKYSENTLLQVKEALLIIAEMKIKLHDYHQSKLGEMEFAEAYYNYRHGLHKNQENLKNSEAGAFMKHISEKIVSYYTKEHLYDESSPESFHQIARSVVQADIYEEKEMQAGVEDLPKRTNNFRQIL